MAGYTTSPEEQAILVAAANPHAAKGAPVRSAAAIVAEGFGPIQRQGAWVFNRGIRFTTPTTGANSELLAAATGGLTFVPAVGPEPPTLALQLTGLDDMALRASGMPSWVPAVRYLLYRGVDAARVQAAIAQLLSDDARRAEANKTFQRITGGSAASAAALAQAFVQHPEQLIDGIPVAVGEVIGAGVQSAGVRTFEFQVGDPGMSNPIIQNPAWYFAFWEMAGLLDLAGHPLASALLRTDQGLEASGTLRFVSQAGNDANVPFTDSALPARTVRAALNAAVDGDTILILDGGTYAEPEIVVDKAINLTSAVALAAEQRHLGGAIDDAAAPAVPANLPVLQGNGAFANIADNMQNDASFIPAANNHRVIRFSVPAGRGTASLTKVVVRYGGAREGAGIFMVESAPVVVSSCYIHRNVAYFNAMFFNPLTSFPHPFPGSGWSQEGFGGGICTYTSSPIIWGNRIERNLALNGGGIGCFARCFPLIARNYIAANVLPDWFGTDTPGDGGGIRMLSLNLRYQTLALSNLDPRNAAQLNQLRQFFMTQFGLTIEVAEMYEPAHITECQQHWIHIRANRVLTNRAGDDGGGVYATGISRVFSVDNVISANIAARGDGGGFRISTASVLRSLNDKIIANQVLGAPSESATGGGIAVRCSDMYLFNALVESNISHFAGAGISFTANREGGVTGVSWLPTPVPTWDEQRRMAFGFDHAHLQIDGTSRVINNLADDAVTGKGGGLYLFRQHDTSVVGGFVGDSVSAEIGFPAAVLDPTNDSAFTDTGGAKPYRRLYLLDQVQSGASGNPPLIRDDAELAVNPAPPLLSHISL